MHRFNSRALASIIAMAAMTAFGLGACLLVVPGNVEANVLRVAPAPNDGPIDTQRSTQPTRAVRIVYPLPTS